MNKHEAIKKVEQMGEYESFVNELIPKLSVLNILNQLDEPQKVTIPQYIADKIEYCKELDDYNLFRAIDYCYNFKKCASWLMFKGNIETLALAWIFGYEVEKEKQYRVKVKGVNEECEYLVFGELSNTWKFRSLGSFGELKKHHTRKELEEANFGWVFDCEGIEVEEVE